MRVLAQRVTSAKCTVDGKITGQIDNGLMILVGFTYGDNKEIIEKI